MAGSGGRWNCLYGSILALILLPLWVVLAWGFLTIPPPTSCTYLSRLLEALSGGLIPCMVFEWMAYVFGEALGFLMLLLIAATFWFVAKCGISIIFWKEYKKYPRIYLNKIKTQEESWSHRFEGSKKNNSADCVIAAVSNVRVPGGYDLVIQPVAAGDTYKPNKGEDFDAFIHRDGSATKFNGRLGSLPFIGQSELSPSEAAEKFGQYMNEALAWFSAHPNC
jgi:hypothetical protein